MSAKIVFLEGPNYCGKSTIIKALTEILSNEGKKVYGTCEPGGNLFEDGIRRLLLDKELNDKCEMDYTCRRFLYAAAHAQKLKELKEKIPEYDYIIVDRYNPVSDLVYGMMSKSKEEKGPYKKYLISQNIFSSFDHSFLKDNATLIFLEISLETLNDRIKARNTTENKIYDYEDLDFKIGIRDNYYYLAHSLKNNRTNIYKDFVPFNDVHIVNANRSANEVARDVIRLLASK
jgi:thymidylate kinase